MTRIETAGLLALTLALAAGMVLPAGAVSGPATLQQTDGEQPSVENVSAAVGQQLSTVLSTTTTEVRSEADEAGFEKRFNESNSTERGAAIADRADELESRAAELRADYEATTEAYRNGEIDASMFAQRIASLTATANTVEGSTDSLADRAAEIPDAERRALGITDSEFDVIYDEIDPVSGRTAGAILSQFTAQDRGEIEIEIDGGISIEVTSEEDGQSRQFERPRDGDGSYELNQSEALDIATDALSAPNGEWVLTSVETDDGAYEFEFALDGPGEGEAEVSVDGATGTVFELEESMEAEDDDDESEFERLVITVTEGEPAPGENVTLTVTGAGEPVENATVELNDGTVGQTDANGTITVTIPSEEAEFEVTAGEAEGELSFEFEEDEDREEELGATADIENGTVTVSVVSNGEPVEGATVTANGASVGTTGANGTVSFDLPAGDELEIEIQDGDREAELEYELEEGEDDSDEDENERDEDDEEDDDEQEDEEQDDGDGEAGDSDDSSDDEDSETETEEVADGTDEESDDEQADGGDEVDDGDDEQADEEDEAEEDDDTDADDEDDEDDE